MKLRVLLALTALLVLGLAACGGGADTAAEGEADGGGVTESAADEGTADAYGRASSAVGGMGQAAGPAPAGAALDEAVAVEEGAVDDGAAVDGDEAQPPVEPLPDAPPVRTGDRIIKEGTITIEVEPDAFDPSFGRVIAAARRFGGDVVGSSTSTDDKGGTYGSVTVRVPVSNFEDLLVGVGEIGTIRDRNIDSQDVSAEYTDLESRLRHLRAQERFYLGLLERATSVNDAIAVQQQLDGIQSQIEQIQGRLNLLEDRTSFSTLTVELFEPGAGGALTIPEDEPNARPSLARYWDMARDAFVNVIGALLVAGLFLLPLLIIAGALFVGWRVLRRPAVPPTRVQPPVEREHEPVGS